MVIGDQFRLTRDQPLDHDGGIVGKTIKGGAGPCGGASTRCTGIVAAAAIATHAIAIPATGRAAMNAARAVTASATPNPIGK